MTLWRYTYEEFFCSEYPFILAFGWIAVERTTERQQKKKVEEEKKYTYSTL